MLTELQQKSVWEAWLSSEIRANYFAELCGDYQWRQKSATWLTLLFSSGAFVAIVADIPPAWSWVKPVCALLAAGLSFLSLVAQNQKNGIDCSDLHFKWNRLAAEYEALWDDMYAEDARKSSRPCS